MTSRSPLFLAPPYLAPLKLALAGLLAVAVAVWAWVTPHPGWGLRGAVVALLLGAGLITNHPRLRPLFLSPLLLLAAVATLLYAVIPAAALVGGPYPGASIKLPARLSAYLGQSGEALILHFAAVCLAGHALTAWLHLAIDRGPLPGAAALMRPPRLAFILAMLALVAAAVHLPQSPHLPFPAAIPDSPLFQSVRGGATVVACTATLLLVWLALSQDRRGWLAFVTVAAVAALLFAGGQGKVPTLMTIAAGVSVVAAHGLSWRRAGVAAVVVVLVPLIVFPVLLLARSGTTRIPAAAASGPDTVTFILKRELIGKGVDRQAETGACLQAVIDRHGTAAPDGHPLFFLTAVVPRALWPGKPDLSQGGVYATQYCGYTAANVGRQSSSITLLGQPLREAGWPGLVVAEVTLMLALAAVTLAAAGLAPAGLGVLAGLVPWLADFDQDFALYLASAARSGGLAVLTAGLVILAGRSGSARRSTAG